MSTKAVSCVRLLLVVLGLPMGLIPTPSPAAERAGSDALQLAIESTANDGPGTLRSALELAAGNPDRPVVISFGNNTGPFSTPQTIELSQPLPAIAGDVTIDGFIDDILWQAYGVTISGGGQHPLFEVMPGGQLRLLGITLRNAVGETGGAVVNHGRLLIESASLLDNKATLAGAAIANYGYAVVVNSTLAWNQAERGGAIANLDGELRIVHATLADNAADQGAAIWSRSDLFVVNSILAGSASQQCFNTGALDPGSTHNLIQNQHLGCGEPLLSEDPSIQSLGYFNGPTPTLPIDGASPALNLALSEASNGIDGQRLKWDQRGNGDPRFAAGFADLGAFERQSQLPKVFVVDTMADTGLRGCTDSVAENCPLAAALRLSAAARNPTPIRFDPDIFTAPAFLSLEEIPDGTNLPLVIDGQGIPSLTISLPRAERLAWQALNGVQLVFRDQQRGRGHD